MYLLSKAMGLVDHMPGGHHSRHPDPKRARKIREGSKRADVMKKISEQHHENLEVPKAEEELEKDLQKINHNS